MKAIPGRLRSIPLLAALALLASGASAERFYIVGGELHVGDGRVVADSVIEVRGER